MPRHVGKAGTSLDRSSLTMQSTRWAPNMICLINEDEEGVIVRQ